MREVRLEGCRDHLGSDTRLRASLTGHLILSSLHTNDAGSTVARLYDVGIDPYLIANSLRAGGLRKVADGATSLEEALRLTADNA